MYSPLKLYYLQQLGVRPWVKKEAPPATPKIIILIPSLLTEKAKYLLNQMLVYLPAENLDVVIEEHFSEQNIPKALKAVLFFNAKEGEKLNLTVPLFPCCELEKLLTEPLLKKEVYVTLQTLMQLLFT